MKLTLLNSNITLNVVQFKSTAIQFNTDFTVDIHANTPELLGDLPNTLITVNTDEGTEILRGLITEVIFYVSHLHGYCYHFIVQSLLFPFSLDLHTRFYRNMTAEDILRKILVSTKFDLNIDLQSTLPVLPQIIQYKETDYTFIERFMAYYGLLGKFEVKGKQCIYHIADRLSAFDIGACPNFPYAPNSKAHEAPVMLSYHQKAELQPQHFIFTEFDAGNPNQSFKLETSSNNLIPGQGETRHHGLGRFDAEIRNRLAQNWQAALDASRTNFSITIDEPCVLLGNTLTVSGSESWEGNAKKYRVIEQTHYYNNEGYRQICRLHPVSEAYYKMPLPSVLPAGILTASVQNNSDENNPYDEAGRYNLKFDLDENQSTSLLMHAMQPSTGATGGFHFPYRAETNVLVQSFGKDALDPVILGAMHLEDQPSLVTSNNAGQHIMTSKGNQTLLMDDNSSVFTINDLASGLSMDASDNPNVNLSTTGLMKLSANSGLLEKVSSNSNYTIGKTHFQTVQDSIHKVSNNHQEISGQDMTKKMGGMELRSESNFALKAGQDFAMSIQSVKLDGDSLLFFTEQGAMNLNSSSGLKLSSGKGINIAQAGASFVMDDSGNTQVIGKNHITLNFSDASLKGLKINLGGDPSLNSKWPMLPKLPYPYLIAQTPLTWNISPERDEITPLTFTPKASDPTGTIYTVEAPGSEIISVNDKPLPFPSNQLETYFQDYQQATGQDAPVPEGNLVLKAKQLFPAVILDWNKPEEGAGVPPLSPDQIKYFKDQGDNAFIFVHGYNVGRGEFGKQITDIQFTPAPALAQGIEMGATGFARASTLNARQTIARNWTQLAELYPEFQQALNAKAALPDSLEEEGTLNGTKDHNWLVHVEDDLNRATGQFNGSDYTKYQRIIGVFWHGQVGLNPLSDVMFPLSEQEADNPTLIQNFCNLLIQLHNAEISINIMAHSLGNRVVLNALNSLGQQGYASVVDHVFMWEAAVANNALSTKEGAPYSKAASAADKITVLYSQNDDFVLNFAYSEDRVLGEEADKTSLNINEILAQPVKTIRTPPPALGYSGPDFKDNSINDLYKNGKLVPADMTPWTNGLPGHSYMLIPNDNIMKHGYQKYILGKKYGVKSFGAYNPANFSSGEDD